MVTEHDIQFTRTGVPEIDDQHAQLVSHLERLLTWIDKGHELAATFDAFASLFAYTETHFEFEEGHMRGHHYPKLLEHSSQHQTIIFGLIRLQSDLLTGKCVTRELTEMLRLWIVQHIDHEDMEYAGFLGTASP